MTAFDTPTLVMFSSLGAFGNRRASALLTTSFLTIICFCQGKYPSLNIFTVYFPGSRLMVLSVAVVKWSFIKTCAPSGALVATKRPVPETAGVPLFKLKRYPIP